MNDSILNKLKEITDISAFHYYNANPRSIRTGDCVVRAISLATGQSWDDVLTDLYELAVRTKCMIHCPELYSIYLRDLGWQHHETPAGNVMLKEWAMQCKTFAIVHVGDDHVTCVKDHQIWDTWNCGSWQVKEYWTRKAGR